MTSVISKNWHWWTLFSILTILSFVVTQKWLDPDFGWHLRTGQLILERGVPHEDWYSYTMPSFPWIDHEWFLDIGMYLADSLFGFNFLLVVFLIVYTAAFFITKKTGQRFSDAAPIIILGYFSTINFLGARPQIFTAFFIAVLWIILKRFLDNASRAIYLLPLLFLLWANVHAGFFAGLFILFAIILLELSLKTNFFKKTSLPNFITVKEQSWSKITTLALVAAISFLATLVNPYGIHLYEEVFRSIGDNFLRFHIAEWLPLFYTQLFTFAEGFNPLIFFYIYLFIGLFMYLKPKVDFNDAVFYLLFLFFSIMSQRHFPIFVIVTVPFLGTLFSLLKYEESSKHKVIVVLLWIIIAVFSLSMVITTFLEKKPLYPEEALTFLQTLPPSENILNEYHWGGYLIWKIPERKVFIDGRMPSWRQDKQFVFSEYIALMSAQANFKDILEKYRISTVLLSKARIKEASTLAKKVEIMRDFLKKYKLLGSSEYSVSQSTTLQEELIKLDWKVAYEDDVALVLQK